ncbi:MAG: hypothetical protein GY861_11695 [bacterium]|nr:hypothetical protein [bacterium]
MAVVFLRSLDGSTVISMDAVTSASYTRTVDVTTSTVFDGSKRSDHVHPNLPSVSFSGVVTTSKVRNTYPSPSDFRRLVDELIDSFELMTFYGTDDGAIPDIDNCYITSFSVERDTTYSDSLLANVTLQQLDISTALTATTITTPRSDTNDQLADNPSKSSDGTKTENTTETDKTIAKQLADQGINAVDLL